MMFIYILGDVDVNSALAAKSTVCVEQQRTGFGKCEHLNGEGNYLVGKKLLDQNEISQF